MNVDKAKREHLTAAGSRCAARLSGAYLSGVAPRIRLPEEGVRQLPHPHGQRRRLPARLAGVHHRAEKGLQLRLRVPADVHDLLPGRRRAVVRVHVAKVRCRR